MQKFLKLLAVLFILVPKCTASSSLPKEIVNYTKVIDDQIRNVNIDEGVNSTNAYIAPEKEEEKIMLLELQINKTNKADQQLNEYKNQIKKEASEIKTISNKDDLIASQRAEIEDKTKLLEDYQLQIAKKELEIKNLQSNLKKPTTICPHEMIISSEENKVLKSGVQKLNDKIHQLENEQKHLNDEIGDKEESCQMDLESERTHSIEKDVTINDMKIEAEANRKLLESQWNDTNYMNARIKEMEIVADNNQIQLSQCQENNMNLQKTEEEKKSVEEKLNECQLNNTNLVKLKDESFKEYQSNQQIILESCENDLESQKNESTYKNVTIKELKEVSEGNHNLWTQCQKNREEIQTELDSYKTKYVNINNLVESCGKQLESQILVTKDLDDCKKNNAELNNRLSSVEKCHKQCNGKGFFKNTWCKAKCKWHC